MKHLGRLLSVVTWLMIVSGIIIISGGLMGRPLLMAAVPTSSMYPVLRPGDLIPVLPTWAARYPGIGDIVVFRTPEDRNWIVHRIVDGNAAEGWVTKGDANPVPDQTRVFQRDMAGVVPQVGGGALRLPRLGLLRAEAGPLSSPLVAGGALALGVLLLALDMQPVRVPHIRRGHGRLRASATFQIYAGLMATAFLTTLIPAWTLSTDEFISYQIIEQRYAQHRPFGRFLPNEVHEEEVKIANPSPLPLLIVFGSDDKHVTYSPWYALVPAKREVVFRARIQNPDIGHHDGRLQMGVFLPLIPPVVLAGLARTNMLLAAMMTAVVPASAVFLLALLDVRVRMAMSQWWTRLVARFTTA